MIERILWDVAAGKLTAEQAQAKLAKIYAKIDAAKRKAKRK
jgi:hypothetical protein